MKKSKVSSFANQYGWLVIISLTLLISLTIMSQVLQSANQFAQLYTSVLLISLVGIFILLMMLFRALKKLRSDYKSKQPGSRITTRLTSFLSLVLGVPLLITYLFSLSFINQGIDQWFDIKTEQALTDALNLVKISLDDQIRNHLNTTLQAAKMHQKPLALTPVLAINNIRKQFNIKEVSLYTLNGQLVAFSNIDDASTQLPTAPIASLFQQIRQERTYAAIESLDSISGNYQAIRVMVPVHNPITNKTQVLHALFPIPDRLTQLTKNVQISAGQYRELSYLKQPLKTSFTVILTVLLLLTFVSSILFTIKILSGMVRPVAILAKGTREVARGDYSVAIPVISNDDLGELTQSFNDMIQQISKARNDIKFSHQQTEVQKLYLQTIIQNLNSGVITLDMNLRLKTINDSANNILEVDLFPELGAPIQDIIKQSESKPLKIFFDEVSPLFTNDAKPWSKQLNFKSEQSQKILLVHGSTLPSLDKKIGGFVIVIEDITSLVKMQLHEAWSDVAKRLAHEIKNPLTPIQLSAERLQYKLSEQLPAKQQEFLSRMTDTIIAQVRAMQDLVQAFTEYADTPKLELKPIRINQLIADITSMYSEPKASWKVSTCLDPNCTTIIADASRIRQLLHNLIKNGIEACEGRKNSQITISTQCTEDNIKISVADNGPGIAESAKNWIFEPYATGKPKGTGLGLAIVKKIVDEHNGTIKVKSNQGTQFELIFPTAQQQELK